MAFYYFVLIAANYALVNHEWLAGYFVSCRWIRIEWPYFMHFQIRRYEKLETVEERRKLAREIYDNFIMKELLSHTHVRKDFIFFPFFPSHSFQIASVFICCTIMYTVTLICT